MSHLIFLRFVTLFTFFNCVWLSLIWIASHRNEWMYAVPPLLIFVHATLFYTFYLLDYFSLRGYPFALQRYADWGSLFLLHVGFTSLFIMIDLVTNWFTHFFERYPCKKVVHG